MHLTEVVRRSGSNPVVEGNQVGLLFDHHPLPHTQYLLKSIMYALPMVGGNWESYILICYKLSSLHQHFDALCLVFFKHARSSFCKPDNNIDCFCRSNQG